MVVFWKEPEENYFDKWETNLISNCIVNSGVYVKDRLKITWITGTML